MLEKSRLYEDWVKPHRNICDPVRMYPISYPFTHKKMLQLPNPQSRNTLQSNTKIPQKGRVKYCQLESTEAEN